MGGWMDGWRDGQTQTFELKFLKLPFSQVSTSLSIPLTPGYVLHLTPSVSESRVQPIGDIFHSENKVWVKKLQINKAIFHKYN